MVLGVLLLCNMSLSKVSNSLYSGEKQILYVHPSVHLWLPFRLESSLLEVLQMDFEVEELNSPLDSQVIVWKLELLSAPDNAAKTEGAMRIYTTQRDFVGLAPLVMVSWTTTPPTTSSGFWSRPDVHDSRACDGAQRTGRNI